MKILVIGDTHGKLGMVRDIWSKLTGVDLVIHTGDYYTDAKDLAEEFHIPFVYVRGNCDGSYSSSNCSPAGWDFAVVETEYGRILVTHGHNERVNYSFDRLIYKALENQCVAAVYGHTHKAAVQELDAGPALRPDACNGTVWVVNPGSLPLPRDGSGGSYAVIRTSEDSFHANIVYYNTVMGGSNKKSGSSGYVSSLLNYSDRF